MLVLGTHMSIAGGLNKTAQNVVKMNANTMQIFSRNPRGSNFKNPSEKEVEEFQKIRKEHHFGPILAHAPYTMNLASAKPEVYEFACDVIREDIQRMDNLGIENIVFHPGSHTGIVTVLLETMSGKGTEIGVRFEELKTIRDGVNHPEKVGICLDTCHVFSAGYDIVNHLEEVLDELDENIGLSYLRAIHLNDSMMPFGSRKDRHATIGDGKIGLEALMKVITNPRLAGIPFYLETPLDDAGHKKEIQMIKEYLKSQGFDTE